MRVGKIISKASVGLVLLFVTSCNKKDDTPQIVPEDQIIYTRQENPLGQTVLHWAEILGKYDLSLTCDNVMTLSATTVPGQDQSMVFLIGTGITSGTTNISIRQNQSIFIPLGYAIYTYPTCPHYTFQIQQGQSVEAFLADACTQITNGIIAQSVTIDGRGITNINNYRYQTPVFNTTANPELLACSFLCYPDGELQTMLEGFFVVLKPLSLGTHILTLHSKNELFGYEFFSTFNITVS